MDEIFRSGSISTFPVLEEQPDGSTFIECAALCTVATECNGFDSRCRLYSRLGSVDLMPAGSGQTGGLHRIHFIEEKLEEAVTFVLSVTLGAMGTPIASLNVTSAVTSSLLGITNSSGILVLESEFANGRNYSIMVGGGEVEKRMLNFTASSPIIEFNISLRVFINSNI